MGDKALRLNIAETTFGAVLTSLGVLITAIGGVTWYKLSQLRQAASSLNVDLLSLAAPLVVVGGVLMIILGMVLLRSGKKRK